MLQFAFKPQEIFGIMEIDGKPQIHRIIEREVIHGDAPPEFVRFVVQVQRPTKLAGPDGRPLMDAAELGLQADTIEDAFAMIPQVLAEWTKVSEANVNKAILMAPAPLGMHGPALNHQQKRSMKNGHVPRITMD